MSLSDVIGRSTEKGSIVEALEERLPESREIPPPTIDSTFWPSKLATICPREEVLASLLRITRIDKVSADLRMIFGHGTGLHDILQNEILPAAKILYGQWRCEACAKLFGEFDLLKPTQLSGLILCPDKCTCGHEEFRYVEARIKSPEWHISGRCDGFLRLPGFHGLGVLEGKSISNKQIASVRNVPKADHLIQCHLYMWLTGLKWGKILYWDKGTHGLKALVEHTIEPDAELIENLKSILLSIRTGHQTGQLPPRICANNTCERALACAVRKQCFDLSENAVLPIL